MKSAEEILKELYCCEPKDEKQDLQLQITLNPDLDRILQAMHEYAEQDRWVKVSERLPELIDGKAKKIMLIDGNKYRFGYYFPEYFKTVEWEDWDDYSEEDFPYTINDKEKGCVWLREGFYIEEYCSHCDMQVFEPFKPTHWQPLPTPPKD